ncbi:MAG: arginine repressor [Bacteroidales bacterium]|nr:arginine repressor [Candidatus Cryptobacteroides onthequi]MCQ2165147.1 arginine repressor [Bacteroidales bacterium]
MKTSRLEAIKKLVSDNKVQNQEDLQLMLKEVGYDVTQATLSRDLRELHIVKVHDSRVGYHYELPQEGASASFFRPSSFSIDSVKSIEFASSHAVIKTYPGFADAVASVIDDNIRNGIMGTIAGDDTVLLILRDNLRREDLITTISFYIPGIEDKIINK